MMGKTSKGSCVQLNVYGYTLTLDMLSIPAKSKRLLNETRGGARSGAGRPKGKMTRDRESIERTLAECGCDPIKGMSMLAEGDVVKLGYMTVKELSAEAVMERNPRTGRWYVLQPSGMQRALELVPPFLRAKMYAELSQYIVPRLAASTISNPDGSALNASVVAQFYLPSNGREAKTETSTTAEED